MTETDLYPTPWRLTDHDGRIAIVAANGAKVTEVGPGQLYGRVPSKAERVALAQRMIDAGNGCARALLIDLLWECKKLFPRGVPYPRAIVAAENWIWGWSMPAADIGGPARSPDAPWLDRTLRMFVSLPEAAGCIQRVADDYKPKPGEHVIKVSPDGTITELDGEDAGEPQVIR